MHLNHPQIATHYSLNLLLSRSVFHLQVTTSHGDLGFRKQRPVCSHDLHLLHFHPPTASHWTQRRNSIERCRGSWQEKWNGIYLFKLSRHILIYRRAETSLGREVGLTIVHPFFCFGVLSAAERSHLPNSKLPAQLAFALLATEKGLTQILPSWSIFYCLIQQTQATLVHRKPVVFRVSRSGKQEVNGCKPRHPPRVLFWGDNGGTSSRHWHLLRDTMLR